MKSRLLKIDLLLIDPCIETQMVHELDDAARIDTPVSLKMKTTIAEEEATTDGVGLLIVIDNCNAVTLAGRTVGDVGMNPIVIEIETWGGDVVIAESSDTPGVVAYRANRENRSHQNRGVPQVLLLESSLDRYQTDERMKYLCMNVSRGR